jgi:hypothetical protein
MFICFQSIYSVLVGFVLSLVNKLTDGVTVHGQKSASEKELLLVRVGVRKMTYFVKGA